MRKIHLSKNFLLVLHKLLNDTLLLLFLSFLGVLVVEGLIPGLISGHIGLSKFILLIILTAGGIIFLGDKLEITYPGPTLSLKTGWLLPSLTLFSFLLIGNSLLRFKFWENILITILTIIIFFFFYRIFFLED